MIETLLRRRLLALAAALLAAAGCHATAGPEETAPAPAAGVTVTYLANEGFLLAAGEQKVLVDALVRGGVSGYPTPPAELRRKLESAEPPFDEVDLVLATHHHADHFDPQAVGEHLRANPQAVFVSTPQAVARLRSDFAGFEAVRERVRELLPPAWDVEMSLAVAAPGSPCRP